MNHTRFPHRHEREARLIHALASLPGETPSLGEKMEQTDNKNAETADGGKKEYLEAGTPELLLSSIVDRRNQKINKASKDAKKEADIVTGAQEFVKKAEATQTGSVNKAKPNIGETLAFEKKLAAAKKADFDDRTEVNKEADAAASLLSVGDLAFGGTSQTKVTQLGNEVPGAAAAVGTNEVTMKSSQEQMAARRGQAESVSEGTGNDAAPADQTRQA